MSSEEPKFKILDKRRFDSDGNSVSKEAKTEEVASTPENVVSAEKETITEKVEIESPEPLKAPEIKEAPLESITEDVDFSTSDVEGYTPDNGINFSNFVVSMATQALAMMGEVSHPELEGVPLNFDAARQSIDIIGLLQEKTKGNLSLEESKLVNELLSSLRMAFVSKQGQQ